MLGDIDYSLKPIQPQYFLCKPNREIIGKLNEVFDASLKIELNNVDELEFSIPLMVDIQHKLVKNKNVDLLRERYLIKTVSGNKIDWYIVKQIVDSVDDDKDIRTVKCYSASHELTDKLIKSYSVESKYCRQVLTDLLANTIWNIDYIDADFDLTYRAFDFPSATVLEAIFSVAETYNAIVEFNTDTRTISFKKPELFGLNRGLTFSYGKYMKSMSRTINTDQMVTRLSAKGKDDLTIHKVNPTGQGYIENFGFFMYPFKRDSNKTVISSSYHMSDSLCHALLDYQELVESKTGVFESYLKQLETYEAELNQLEIDLNKLKNNEAVITDTMLAQQFDDKMFFEKYTHNGNSSRTFKLNSTYAYAVMIKVDNASGSSIYLNGQAKTVSSGKWVLLGKVNNTPSVQVVVNGGNTGVFIQVANISLSEYSSNGNDLDIIERYSLDNKENQINLKVIEINNKTSQIKGIKAQIADLQATLLTTNNFTSAQLQELNTFVIEREFNDDTYVDEKDLYAAVQEKFKELQQPELSIDVDIINFLEIVGEQRNWDKLVLGDFVNVKYEPTNTYITARITAIEFDYENSSINLTLSNAKRGDEETRRLEKFLSDAKNTNVVVDNSKNKWGQAVVSSNNMTKLFENFWNNVTNQINMANNEYVQIDNRGITIYNINDRNKFVRMTHGAIGMTDNGGLLYKMAITPTHIVAENVWGKLFVGERLTLGDVDGLLEITGPKFMIFDRCEREVQRIGLLETNPDLFGTYVNRYASDNCNDKTIVNKVSMTNKDGFTIERVRNGKKEKTFGTSLDGDLYIKAGVDDEVFTIDKYGLALGSSIWANAPFRVNYKGQCWLEALWATDAFLTNAYIENSNIDKSEFDDGHIRGSDLELRNNKGGMIKMYPEYGLWFGTENFEDAVSSFAMDGTAKLKKLIVTDGNNTLLMDSEKKAFYANEWDMIGLGAIDAELLAANILSVQDGIISNLTAGKLSTLTNAALNDWSNYIRIEGNSIKHITGKVKQGSGTHKKLPDGRPLYWVSAEQTGIMTVNQTAWPVLVYDMEEKVKQEITFEGSGDDAQPIRTIGLGDGTPNGAKAIETKYKGGYKLTYGQSNTGKERSIDLADTGVFINSENGLTTVTTKDFTVSAENGTVKIGNSQGCLIEMSGKTMTFKAGDFQFVNV